MNTLGERASAAGARHMVTLFCSTADCPQRTTASSCFLCWRKWMKELGKVMISKNYPLFFNSLGP